MIVARRIHKEVEVMVGAPIARTNDTLYFSVDFVFLYVNSYVGFLAMYLNKKKWSSSLVARSHTIKSWISRVYWVRTPTPAAKLTGINKFILLSYLVFKIMHNLFKYYIRNLVDFFH